jgi:hypothetical protein
MISHPYNLRYARQPEQIIPGPKTASANQAPFFPKLSNTEQQFIPGWPIIGKFN